MAVHERVKVRLPLFGREGMVEEKRRVVGLKLKGLQVAHHDAVQVAES